LVKDAEHVMIKHSKYLFTVLKQKNNFSWVLFKDGLIFFFKVNLVRKSDMINTL